MNFRNLMIVTAVTTIGFGAGFVIAPTQLGSFSNMAVLTGQSLDSAARYGRCQSPVMED